MNASLNFIDDTDVDDFTTTVITNKNILVVGLTGSGKSSIISAICNVQEGKEISQMSCKSVTTNLTMYPNNKIVNPTKKSDEYSINCFDTVGLGDGKISVPVILKQIIDLMPKQLSTIHQVVFCFKMDRLRAEMSKELSIVYNFFKLVGAKPEHFTICLTFCDILNNQTIKRFWDELATIELPLVKEISKVTYTSFPNLKEVDSDEGLQEYLRKKFKMSKRRVFQSIIEGQIEPFYPFETFSEMTDIDFNNLCQVLQDFKMPTNWLWRLWDKSEQDEIIKQLKAFRRQPATIEA
jgi:GTPase SAR1 family protein